MDIRHLRYFVAIADAGSLMKASERLCVAQPSLSVHLSNLEVELGARLVERSSRGVSLTVEGETLYERAKKLLRYHEDEIMSLRASRANPLGQVSLGLPSTLPNLIAPQLYRAMKEQLPDVRLYLVDASSAALYEWLENGKIDFAILFSLPKNIGLELTPLYMEEFCLIGRPEVVGTGEIDFAELADRPLMLPCATSTWRKLLNISAKRRGIELQSPIETESTTALRAAALSGECQSIMPLSSVNEDVKAGRLVARRIVNPEIRGVKSLANLENKTMTAAQLETRKLICRVIKDAFKHLDYEVQQLTEPRASLLAPTAIFQRPRKLSSSISSESLPN